MKKTYILIILFTVIILGITAGTYIFISNENKRTENNNVKDVINKVSDKMEKMQLIFLILLRFIERNRFFL